MQKNTASPVELKAPTIIKTGIQKVCIHPSSKGVYEDAVARIKKKHIARQDLNVLEADWESGVVALKSALDLVDCEHPSETAEKVIERVIKAHKQTLKTDRQGKSLKSHYRIAITASEMLRTFVGLFDINSVEGGSLKLTPKNEETTSLIGFESQIEAMYALLFSEPQQQLFERLGHEHQILAGFLDTNN